MQNLIARFKSDRRLALVAGATALVLVAALVAVATMDNGSKKVSKVAAGNTTTSAAGLSGGVDESTTALGTDTTAATAPGTKTTVKKSGSGSTATPGHTTEVTLASSQGATRVGVSASSIKWGLHAPKTLQGVPWGLADDVLKGTRIYLNQINQQKVNGRTISEYFADDQYSTDKGAAAGDTLIRDDKVFFAQGTLGVDQIAQVAKKARASTPSPTPYLAAGGSESKFKDIGMFQVAGSYDSHLVALVHFLDTEWAKPPCPTPLDGKCPLDKSPYGHLGAGPSGTGKMKVGVSALNSEYIAPAVDAVKAAVAASSHLQMDKVVTVEKPEGGGQTTYTNQVLQLSGADVVIPAQDPISTSREVQECITQQAAGCHFMWAISNFAHDGDVDLALMGGHWTGYRGLSTGCYYFEYSKPDAPKCAKLATAHDLWIHGTDPNVDNGGGDKGDGSLQSESTWSGNGQAGVAGYQLTHIWLKALKDAGPDLTREKFLAALHAYSGYDDLVTVPMTYAGSSNVSHGVAGFAIYQAGPPNEAGKPKGVGWSQLSDGLIGSF